MLETFQMTVINELRLCFGRMYLWSGSVGVYGSEGNI